MTNRQTSLFNLPSETGTTGDNKMKTAHGYGHPVCDARDGEIWSFGKGRYAVTNNPMGIRQGVTTTLRELDDEDQKCRGLAEGEVAGAMLRRAMAGTSGQSRRHQVIDGRDVYNEVEGHPVFVEAFRRAFKKFAPAEVTELL